MSRLRTLTPIVVILALTALSCRGRMEHQPPAPTSDLIRQSKRNTCGPAALAMLLAARGRVVTESELERAMSPGPDGVSLSKIVSTAKAYGVSLEAWRVRSEDLPHMPMPAILWIDGDHFVVLDSVARDIAFLRNPASGRRSVSVRHLRNRWDGTLAVFADP